jgi:multicomponent Na+:H+ antiporter subunit E
VSRRFPRLPRLLWLTVVWVALWEDVSVANVAGGLVVAGALVLAFPPPVRPDAVVVRPLATLRFLAHFTWKLVEASAIVAWEVVTPRNRINEGIVAVPLHTSSDAVVTIVANAVSLTPGTLSVEAHRDPPALYVHVLHLRDIEAVRRDVQRLEALAVLAFGTGALLERDGERRLRARAAPGGLVQRASARRGDGADARRDQEVP